MSLADFDRRRDPGFRDGPMEAVTAWDGMIEDLNAGIARAVPRADPESGPPGSETSPARPPGRPAA